MIPNSFTQGEEYVLSIDRDRWKLGAGPGNTRAPCGVVEST